VSVTYTAGLPDWESKCDDEGKKRAQEAIDASCRSDVLAEALCDGHIVTNATVTDEKYRRQCKLNALVAGFYGCIYG